MENKLFISSKKLLFITQRKVSTLFVLVFLASFTLIFINFYTIKTTSAVRAYINGESEYSKGQKDALLYLLTYTQTEDEKYWASFKTSLDVPIGDNIARQNLVSNGNNQIIKSGFLRGKNNPDDLEQMIWLFKNFQSVSFMKQAIQLWQNAEPLINELSAIGNELNQKIKTNTLTAERRHELVNRISLITTELTLRERAFSNVLGDAARTINQYLFYANVFFIILIVGSLVGYAVNMIKKLLVSKKALLERNRDLTSINHELDNFVNVASHDLRAPITSLKGLIHVTMDENDAVKIKEYLKIMNGVIDRQDDFIKEIIEFSRNKLTSVIIEKMSLAIVIDEAIAQNQYSPEAYGIEIKKELEVDTIYSDAIRMKIILNNLISNAYKYSDDSKSNKYILIKTNKSVHECIITVEDNGLGISKEHHARIFEMFFVSKSNKKKYRFRFIHYQRKLYRN